MLTFAEYIYAEAERNLAKYDKDRERCAWCGEPIHDDYAYRINGELVCEDCIKDTKEWID